jgi:glycosyltransferase involved in cell wall biosynthesis
MHNKKTIAVVMHDFRGGGAERVSVSLCNGFAAEGIIVKIIVINKIGPMIKELNKTIQVIELNNTRTLLSILELRTVVKKLKPNLIISHMTHVNIATCISSLLGGFSKKLVIVEHNQMHKNYEVIDKQSVKLAYWLTKILYKYVYKIVAVSEGVKVSVIDFTSVNKSKIDVIYNPVVNESLLKYQLDPKKKIHRFFNQKQPVFVCVGSLTIQKNHMLFMKAFREVRSKIDAKAIIIGEGPLRLDLEKAAVNLGIENDIDLPGFVNNPYDYMKKASAIVLSSSWEGLPTVLIESLALSKSIVSTNCASGPDEILNSGEFGVLTRVDNVDEFAQGMHKAVNSPQQNFRNRALDFTVTNAVNKFCRYLNHAQ